MRKILISGLVIIALGVAGCGAAPTKENDKGFKPAKEAVFGEAEGISWPEIEKHILNSDTFDFWEVQGKIDNLGYEYEIKEDIKAVIGEMDYQGYTDMNHIKTECAKLWEMRKESPDTWLYDYGVEVEKNK